ncbi:RNA-binding S4 domain-containing protein [Lysinibacter cavernae]|uniref:Ribosome-associated heat shock protein Hsp15 n=1 Tax=Lysinibacter cavernae TaxID=1640652 RepID=A0A7X5TSE3_9MICO|nr:S4 domain-containing protein [Lysinibacter cavernae]NIH52900.1 ribosome-associated heat shock protein Hsp15 [Lysinibacter cavernae]
MTDPQSVRVDSWLWAVRATKTRSLATSACRAGHVRVADTRVKAAQTVKVGDTVRLRVSGFDRILVVKRLITKRVSAAVAAECFEDLTPPPPKPEDAPAVPIRDRGAGRPTKRERRDLEKLRGRVPGGESLERVESQGTKDLF